MSGKRRIRDARTLRMCNGPHSLWPVGQERSQKLAWELVSSRKEEREIRI